jgi:DNA-binding MarR family transcriptional regulator
MDKTDDFIRELRELGLGSRLKRLSERLNKSVAMIYRDQEVVFEPFWFPTVYLLYREKELSVTEIASALQMTHPAIIHILKDLEKQGYIRRRPDKTDKRRFILSLSPKGRGVVEKLIPVWEAIRATAASLLMETNYNLLDNLTEIEEALDKIEYYDRYQKNRREK